MLLRDILKKFRVELELHELLLAVDFPGVYTSYETNTDEDSTSYVFYDELDEHKYSISINPDNPDMTLYFTYLSEPSDNPTMGMMDIYNHLGFPVSSTGVFFK